VNRTGTELAGHTRDRASDLCGATYPGPGFLRHAGLPEWSKGVVCKTASSAYIGSNPTPATLYRPRIPGPALILSHRSDPCSRREKERFTELSSREMASWSGVGLVHI
jgi:hypothetical protein